MPHAPKNFSHLLGLAGFSDNLLTDHFTLYQGYVTNVNKLDEARAEMSKAGKLGASEWAELTRRYGWEFNGMRLHELYFENMTKGGAPLPPKSALYKKISKDFGSCENWEKDFRALGVMRGIGWVVLYYDWETRRLLNVWVNEHDVGHISGAIPLLVMDVFEHAYILDYRLKRADYIAAFFKAMDGKVIAERFEEAMRL